MKQSSPQSPQCSRREFLNWGGKVAAGSVLAGVTLPAVHAAGDSTIRLALIGCGGRGRGAAANALETSGGPVQLHALADLFDDRTEAAHKVLSQKYAPLVNVPAGRRFVGFDAFRHAIDSLRPGDVALLTTNAYCRPAHFDYAVDKGLHVFMEKSFAPDPGGLRRMLRAGERANNKKLKIAAGLMCRHSVARQAFIEKVRAGELGELQLIRAYRMAGAAHLRNPDPKTNTVGWQIQNKAHFYWASSGRFIEHLIHQIDECCWLKDAWPVSAHGLGGRVPNSPDCGQNLDVYAIEYTFADGTKAMVDCRFMNNCHVDFATYVHGTKRGGQFSGQTHAATVQTYKDQRMTRDNLDWRADKEPCSPWQAEWNVLMDAIRRDLPHNETEPAIKANFASILGRAAVHYGSVLTWDEVFASDFQFCPQVDTLAFDSPPPVLPDAQGRYPVPLPGEWKEI